MASPADTFAALMQIPGLQELLNQSVTNARQQAPLRTAATQTALNMLPNSSYAPDSQAPGSIRPNVAAIPPANYSTPAPSNGSTLGTVLKYLAAGGAGAIAGQTGSGSSFDPVKLAGLLKKLFGGRGGASERMPTNDPASELDWSALERNTLQPQMGMPNALPGGIDIPPYDFGGGDSGLSPGWQDEGVG